MEGRSLRERLDTERQLPIDEALRTTREVASALDYAHRQRVVHRDIKPENILFHEGNSMVADFGIGKALTGAAGVTQAGLAIGTPAYMSPEQAGGEDIDGRSVLPLANMSTDPENEYFSDGMTEEIIGALSKVPGLQVASRTSCFAFKGKEVDIKQVGEKLGVGTVLTGSVRKVGNRIRITTQLVNVESGYHLWSETYDRQLEDVFAIQDEISRAIVEALKIRLTGDAEAYAGSRSWSGRCRSCSRNWERDGPGR